MYHCDSSEPLTRSYIELLTEIERFLTGSQSLMESTYDDHRLHLYHAEIDRKRREIERLRGKIREIKETIRRRKDLERIRKINCTLGDSNRG